MVLPTITSDNIIKGHPKQYSLRAVGEFLIEKLAEHGSAVVLVDSATGIEVTAHDLLQDVVTVAEAMRRRGIGPGSIVGVCSENRLEYPIPALASLAIGATCAPLNPNYTPGELEHTMKISEPSIVFCSPATSLKLSYLKNKLPFIHEIIVFGESVAVGTAFKNLLESPVCPEKFRPEVFDPKNTISVILCSSGTTGLPKCVELTHSNFMVFLENVLDERVTSSVESDVCLGLLPFFHGYGFAYFTITLVLKLKLIVMAGFQPQIFLKSIQDYKITNLALVPSLIVFLAKHAMVDQYDLSSLRLINCGAAPLSRDTQLAAQQRLGIADIKQAYGMTELSISCCTTHKNISKIGSSGTVTFGMECKVIDLKTGLALPPLVKGELCFRGPLVMKGYRNNKKATDEIIDKDGWLHTGDIGYYDNEGFLFVVDRLKELIKYKGFQVAPAELEAILLQYPGIKDASVIGIPDDVAGELPYAFIVLQPDARLSGPDIQKYVAGKVSAHKWLYGGVQFLAEIPKTPSGKVIKRELRLLYRSKPKLKL